MRRWAHPLVAFLLAACGPKASGTSGGEGSGSAGGGSAATAGSEGATEGSATGASDTGMEGRVVYIARCTFSNSLGIYGLLIDKSRVDADYCTRIAFRFPGVNNSGEFGIEYPPDPDWQVTRPDVIPSGDCIADSEERIDVLATSGTVWWDEAMSFVDVDVTLTLPPAPRWPDTDVLFVEGLAVHDDQCPGNPTGTSGG